VIDPKFFIIYIHKQAFGVWAPPEPKGRAISGKQTLAIASLNFGQGTLPSLRSGSGTGLGIQFGHDPLFDTERDGILALCVRLNLALY
jgi:hypothetical protein